MPNEGRRSGPYRSLDIIGLLLGIGLLFICIELLHDPTALNIALLLFFAFLLTRLAYELIFNRHRIPVSASAFFERREIAELLQKDFQRQTRDHYVIMDLGSGFGELTRTIARACPQATVIGIEKSNLAYRLAQFLQKLFRIRNLSYRNADLFSCDCAQADAVVMYLGDELTLRADRKLWTELRPGALVITNESAFAVEWQPEQIIEAYKPFKMKLFVYRR